VWPNKQTAVSNHFQPQPEIPFADRYKDKFEKAKEKCKDTLAAALVSETNYIISVVPQPIGMVIMQYKKGSFYYYSNTSSIPYAYLETIGRKYAITFGCPELLVVATKTNLKENTDMDTGKKEIIESKKKMPFIKLKRPIAVRSRYSEEDSNLNVRYIHAGRMSDFNILGKPAINVNNNNNKCVPINYAEFKASQSQFK